MGGDKKKMEVIVDGTATSPLGFEAGAVACGLKESGNLDLALLYSEKDCTVAGVFTRNQVVAAPVILNRKTLAQNRNHIRGVVINAGNANACTGEQGIAAADDMQATAAGLFNCNPEQFFVLSTGIIGVPLPVEKVGAGLRIAINKMSAENGAAAAEAITTTDTYAKYLALQMPLAGGLVTIGGMAKGAAMIHPNMATMLGIITTDAEIPAGALQDLLTSAVNGSFNRISVDGDTSTNDSVLLLANGASGVVLEDGESLARFAEGLTYICTELAKMIVRDGEGASKFVEVQVRGAGRDSAAQAVAETIVTSPLVKTALAGSDANWGRILAAAGRAGVTFDQEQVDLWVCNPGAAPLQLVAKGEPTPYSEDEAAAIFARPEIDIHLSLGSGDGTCTFWTCDLTREYVSLNADYRT